MPVEELAPALLALGNVFSAASAVVRPGEKPVTLSIEANEVGSFWVHIVAESERAWDQIVDIFGSAGADALANLKELIIGSYGVFWLIKRLHGRKVRSQHAAPKPGHVVLTLDDETSIDVPADTVTLYQNIDVRKRARQVVAPLEREGIEEVRFTEETETRITIRKIDLPAYEVAAEEGDALLESEREMAVEIVSPSFAEGNKWRFSTGQDTFFAAIEDERFVERIDTGEEAFRKDDILRCRMRIVQQRTPDGRLHSDYHVVEVLQHLPRQTQLTINEPPVIEGPPRELPSGEAE